MSEKKLKSVNIRQSYKQERGCLYVCGRRLHAAIGLTGLTLSTSCSCTPTKSNQIKQVCFGASYLGSQHDATRWHNSGAFSAYICCPRQCCQSGLPLSFLNWAYRVRTPGGSISGRIVRQGYRFSAFSYAKPSDFRRNFRPTRIEATKIFVGLQVFLVTISKDGLHMLHI